MAFVKVPPHARAAAAARGHRFAAYPRCSTDLSCAMLSRSHGTGGPPLTLIRRAVGVILGYVIFAATAVLLFRLSGHDPHAVQPVAFIAASVAYGIFFAILGGYVSGVVGGGSPWVQAGLVGALIALGATVSLLAGPKAGSTWSRVAALTVMAPSSLLGGVARARTSHRTGSSS
jgi:hypothetical protein